ncbi:RNA methyltransferase [Candidatus Kapabacteria bacterium]|nr:RNA methyltransferase [Candidatus Kapabacteria bacterium]
MHYAIPITQKLRKLVRSLNQKQNRDQNHLFLAEGEKLCGEAYKSDFQVELLVVRDSPAAEVLEIVDNFADEGIPIYNAPKHQFDQMATTKSPQGIVSVITKKELPITPNENVVILDGVNDPGNLGTIIRTAEWFGFKQVIIGSDSADHFNPKAVRSSMGAIFRMPVKSYDDLAEEVKENFGEIELFGATLDNKKYMIDSKPKGKFGLVFGSESHGISKDLIAQLTSNYTIKGIGDTESLNVAIAAGVSFNHFSQFIKN